MKLAQWFRIAGLLLITGGIGYLSKYVLLVVFDAHGTSTSGTLQAVTRVGLLLGEFLQPVGFAIITALWLYGRHWIIVALSVVGTLALLYLVAGWLDTGLNAGFGNQDPARLRTEGSLALIGAAALLTGLLALRESKRRRSPQTQPVARTS